MKQDIEIPFTDFGGKGSIIHFSHGNGMPPKSYSQLMELLQQNHQVIASHHRPIWKTNPKLEEVANWDALAEDLIYFLDSQIKEKVYGVGHSLGGVVTLLAAIKRPDLFKSIILIEPAMLPPHIVRLTGLTPSFFKKCIIPPVKKALNRPDTWESKQEAFDFHRTKRVFQKLSDDVLWDYIECGTEMNIDKKYTLRFSKEWEAHIIGKLPNVWPLLDKCSVPVLGIRGEESDTLLPSAWERWKRKAPKHQFVEIPKTGHLLPFEDPEVTAELVLQLTAA